MRIKKQETRLSLQEFDDNYDDNDDMRRDRTIFIMRIKEQETRLRLQEYDDDDDNDNDDDPRKRRRDKIYHENQGTGYTPNTTGIC